MLPNTMTRFHCSLVETQSLHNICRLEFWMYMVYAFVPQQPISICDFRCPTIDQEYFTENIQAYTPVTRSMQKSSDFMN